MVTGGFGFVGRHLVRMLAERGDKVTVFDIVPGSKFLDGIKDNFNSRVGDLATGCTSLDGVEHPISQEGQFPSKRAATSGA